LSYITSVHLGDGTWKSNTHKFILNWEEQVRQYEKLVELTDHFSEAIKMQMLQNCVHPIPELRQVKTQADQIMTHSGKKLTYSKYVVLLSSASAQYDSQFESNLGPKAAVRRQVSMHESYSSQDVYNIDTPTSTILTNRTSFEAMMPGPVWSKLTPEDKAIWDKLSDQTKTLILNARSWGDTKYP